jgi:hypothetical protein
MSDATAQNASVYLGVRISPDLKSAIDSDARKLNVSVADIVRFRLRSGTIPTLKLMPSGK